MATLRLNFISWRWLSFVGPSGNTRSWKKPGNNATVEQSWLNKEARLPILTTLVFLEEVIHIHCLVFGSSCCLQYQKILKGWLFKSKFQWLDSEQKHSPASALHPKAWFLPSCGDFCGNVLPGRLYFLLSTDISIVPVLSDVYFPRRKRN